MSSGGFHLDEGTMRAAVAKAIFDEITPEQQSELVAKAIQGLVITPKDDRPHHLRTQPLRSPLEKAFADAVQRAAEVMVMEYVRESEEVQQAIRDAVHPMVTDLCEGNYQGLPEEIGKAFGVWLRDRKGAF